MWILTLILLITNARIILLQVEEDIERDASERGRKDLEYKKRLRNELIFRSSKRCLII